MIEIGLIGGSLITVTLFAAVVTMPSWCFGSVWRDRLWALRDELVRHVVDGELPADHPAVHELRASLEKRRLVRTPARLIDLILFDRLILQRVGPRELRQLDQLPKLDDLTTDQQELIIGYREQCAVLSGGAIISSSWLGALTILGSYLASTPRSFSDAVRRISRWRITKPAARSARRSGTLVNA